MANAEPRPTMGIKVMISRGEWAQLIQDANINNWSTLNSNAGPVPGFRGRARELARFMLAAHAKLGIYDSTMLGEIVGSFEPNLEDGLTTFFFPGLELY